MSPLLYEDYFVIVLNEIIAVSSENRIKHVNTLWGKYYVFLILKQVVP
jgi:hypothetical protein